MDLELNTRQVGRVTVVRCSGRIIAANSESLHAHVNYLLRDRRSILLHLGDVEFMDSSGLGTMVRALSLTRQARGELKVCSAQPFVRRVFDMTALNKVFELHDSEEGALAAFYKPSAAHEVVAHTGKTLLVYCPELNVLAYLRELLRHAGYEVQTASLLNDAKLLMRVTKVDLVVVSAGKAELLASSVAVREASARMPLLELESDFATKHAGESGADLLKLVDEKLRGGN